MMISKLQKTIVNWLPVTIKINYFQERWTKNSTRKSRFREDIKYNCKKGKKHNNDHKVIKTGLTLEEAQDHCQRDDTREAGVWFDGYYQEDLRNE